MVQWRFTMSPKSQDPKPTGSQEPDPAHPSRWLHRLGHEVGNSVWALSGYSELLRRAIQSEDSAKVRKHLETLEASVRRFLSQADSLRLAALCHQELATSGEADLLHAYSGLCPSLEAEFPEQASRLSPPPSQALPVPLPVLRGWLRILLENALMHGTGEISVQVPSEQSFTISHQAPEAVDFETWFEAGHSNSGRLGLGLSILRQSLELHGFQGVFSYEAATLSFCVSPQDVPEAALPPADSKAVSDSLEPAKASAPDPAPPPEAEPGEAPFPGTRILYVDDAETNRLAFPAALKALGASVEAAAGIEDSAVRLEVGDFDLVVTDLHLGSESGLDLFQGLPEGVSRPPLVGLSALSPEQFWALPHARDRVLAFLSKEGDFSLLARELAEIWTKIQAGECLLPPLPEETSKEPTPAPSPEPAPEESPESTSEASPPTAALPKSLKTFLEKAIESPDSSFRKACYFECQSLLAGSPEPEPEDLDCFILHLEDQVNLQRVVEDLLAAAGYRSRGYASLKEGLLGLEQGFVPKLLLVDWSLPDGNGLEFVEAARKVLGHQDTPVLILTGQGDESIRSAFAEVGCCHFLTKPVDSKTFLDAVQKLLGPPEVSPRRRLEEWLGTQIASKTPAKSLPDWLQDMLMN